MLHLTNVNHSDTTELKTSQKHEPNNKVMERRNKGTQLSEVENNPVHDSDKMLHESTEGVQSGNTNLSCNISLLFGAAF